MIPEGLPPDCLKVATLNANAFAVHTTPSRIRVALGESILNEPARWHSAVVLDRESAMMLHSMLGNMLDQLARQEEAGAG